MCSVALEQQLRPRGELLLQEFEVRILNGCVKGKPLIDRRLCAIVGITPEKRARVRDRLVDHAICHGMGGRFNGKEQDEAQTSAKIHS
jgi:hypothetical protein